MTRQRDGSRPRSVADADPSAPPDHSFSQSASVPLRREPPDQNPTGNLGNGDGVVAITIMLFGHRCRLPLPPYHLLLRSFRFSRRPIAAPATHTRKIVRRPPTSHLIPSSSPPRSATTTPSMEKVGLRWTRPSGNIGELGLNDGIINPPPPGWPLLEPC